MQFSVRQWKLHCGVFTCSHLFLPQPLNLWSAHLRSRKSLPPRLLHPPKKSPPQCWPLRSPSPLLLPPRCLLKKIRPPSCWRITSHIWDPSLGLTTGSSTLLEESLVWYSTDELACRSSLSMSICLLFCSPFDLRSFQLPSPHGQPGQIFFFFRSLHQIQDQMRSCTFAPTSPPHPLTPPQLLFLFS